MKRNGFLWSGLLLAMLFGGGFWFYWHRLPRPVVVRFPNGMVARHLATVRAGGSFDIDPQWEKLARRVLPRRWQNWIPRPVRGRADATSRNSVTVFWEVMDPNGRAVRQPPWGEYATEDRSGFRFAPGTGFSSWSGSRPGRRVYALTLRAFPRRSDTFQFDFLDRQGNLEASARLPNLVRGPFPVWKPYALPITHTNGPLTLTLKGLSETGHGLNRGLRAEWALTTTDPRWKRAQPSSIQCEDATGNEGRFLSLKEPAWRLRTWVRRLRPESFTAKERLVLTNLTIPGPGKSQPLNVTAVRAGVTLRVECLAGPGRLFVTNGVSLGMRPSTGRGSGFSLLSQGKNRIESWGSARPFFLIEAEGLAAHDGIWFRLLGPQGERIELDALGQSWKRGRTWSYQRKFTPPSGVKTVSLEIMISRGRKFEFLIDPAEIKRR